MPKNFISLFGSGGDLLPVAAGGGVAPSLVKSAANVTGNDASFVDTAFTGNVTSGNLIVVQAFGRSSGADDIYVAQMCQLETGGSTCTIDTPVLHIQTTNLNPGANSYPVAIWTAKVTGTGTCTIRIVHTFTPWGGSTNRSWVRVSEWSDIDTTGTRIDGTPVANTADNTTSVSTGNTSTTGAGVIFAVLGMGDGATISAITDDSLFTDGTTQVTGGTTAGSMTCRRVTSSTTDAADSSVTGGNTYLATCIAAIKSSTP
jgi:hypothetical protein